jgi:hypothetical protein
MIMSRGLRGCPAAVPSAIRRAQTRPAFSSNGSQVYLAASHDGAFEIQIGSDQRRPDQFTVGVEPENLEPGHPTLLEALPVVVERSSLCSIAHGEILCISSNISRS